MAGIPVPTSPVVDKDSGLATQDWFRYLAGQTKQWVPVDSSGASLVFTGVSAQWTQLGKLVFAYAQLTYPATGNGAAAVIGGLPVLVPNANYAKQGFITYTTSTTAKLILPIVSTITASLLGAAGVGCTNANMSGTTLNFMLIYPVA